MGLTLFVFPQTSLLQYNFATLDQLFDLAPMVFMFLIPAITMRTFSDEFRLGTIEILKTKPISKWQIVLGKFFGALVLIILALLPTLIYVFSILKLGNPPNNLDIGSTIGSYFGLLFIAGAYTSIGIFTSTFSNNQIVAFVLSVFIVFALFYGFDAMSSMFKNSEYLVQQFGINEHFKSISRGVIDTRDVLYFVSVTFFFLFITKQQLKNE